MDYYDRKILQYLEDRLRAGKRSLYSSDSGSATVREIWKGTGSLAESTVRRRLDNLISLGKVKTAGYGYRDARLYVATTSASVAHDGYGDVIKKWESGNEREDDYSRRCMQKIMSGDSSVRGQSGYSGGGTFLYKCFARFGHSGNHRAYNISDSDPWGNRVDPGKGWTVEWGSAADGAQPYDRSEQCQSYSSAKGFFCNAVKGHPGLHTSYGRGETIIGTWEQDGERHHTGHSHYRPWHPRLCRARYGDLARCTCEDVTFEDGMDPMLDPGGRIPEDESPANASERRQWRIRS
jgi:DNA-binding Lrp family transcriptional regulator